MAAYIVCGYRTEHHKDPCTWPKGHECPHWYTPREPKDPKEGGGPKIGLKQLRIRLEMLEKELKRKQTDGTKPE